MNCKGPSISDVIQENYLGFAYIMGGFLTKNIFKGEVGTVDQLNLHMSKIKYPYILPFIKIQTNTLGAANAWITGN